MKRRRKLMHVGSFGNDLVRRLDPHGVRHTSRIVAAWPQVAGAKVDEHTLGFQLKDGQLLVYVDSPMWANELSMMSEEYRSRLNQEAGEEAVRKIRFVVSNKVQRERESGLEPDEPSGLGPARPPRLSKAERSGIERAASVITDAGLREAALAAMDGRTGGDGVAEQVEDEGPEDGAERTYKNNA